MPIHVPMVAVHTVGAGGGSIARVDASGLIQVGPESAGANPGPICYGRGGAEPTITDANLLLGRLDPKRLLAVDAPVTVEHVQEDLRGEDRPPPPASTRSPPPARCCGSATSRWPARSAWSRCRAATIPRDFALFAFGGAGPLHATALARELGLPTVLVPARPGITNALGCVVADLRHDFVNTINQPVAAARRSQRSREILRTAIADEGEALIAKEAVAPETIRIDPFGRHAVSSGRRISSTCRCPRRRFPARCCRICSKRPISPASGSSCRKSAPISSTSTHRSSACGRDVDLQPADRSRPAAPRRSTTPGARSGPSGMTARGSTRRSIHARNCRSTR